MYLYKKFNFMEYNLYARKTVFKKTWEIKFTFYAKISFIMQLKSQRNSNHFSFFLFFERQKYPGFFRCVGHDDVKSRHQFELPRRRANIQHWVCFYAGWRSNNELHIAISYYPADEFLFSFLLLTSTSVFQLGCSSGLDIIKYQHSSKPYRCMQSYWKTRSI